MTPAEAMAVVQSRTGRDPVRAVPLEGGLLNHVFRVAFADGDTVVLKHAPPYVARLPHVPLDPARSGIEARALRLQDGRRAPRLVDAFEHTLLIEDIGTAADLTTWLARGGDPSVLDRLAAWLRALHDGPAPPWSNPSVQQTRLELQYRPAVGWLGALGLPDAAALGAALSALGDRFLRGGPHFVMGDLWPPSVRVRSATDFVVLDWELATRGHRAQDVGHLMAHLELEAVVGALPRGLSDRFLAAYGALSTVEERDVGLHAAAELLARTVGAFPRAGLSPAARHAVVERAVQRLRAATTL